MQAKSGVQRKERKGAEEEAYELSRFYPVIQVGAHRRASRASRAHDDASLLRLDLPAPGP